MDSQTGVTNPFALGELVVGHRIDWDSLENPAASLSEILTISEEDIFSVYQPILSPTVAINAEGEAITLDPEEAISRVTMFLEERNALVISPTIDPYSLGLTEDIWLEDIALIEIFQKLLTQAKSTDEPWFPTDKAWVDRGDYFDDVATLEDPIQGYLGDCYFIAALSAVAWSRPHIIANIVRPSSWDDDHSPIHQITFYKEGKGDGQIVEVSEKVPVLKKDGKSYVYAKSLDDREIWPAVMEKAYAKWISNNTTDYPNYSSIEGGFSEVACAELIRGKAYKKYLSGNKKEEIISFIRQNCLDGRTVNPMGASTYTQHPKGKGYEKKAGLYSQHAYALLGWTWHASEYYVVLRNPWGSSPGTKDTLSGSWDTSMNGSFKNVAIRIPFNKNGVFAMKLSTFMDYFEDVSVAL